jgi:hypothetical protein
MLLSYLKTFLKGLALAVFMYLYILVMFVLG